MHKRVGNLAASRALPYEAAHSLSRRTEPLSGKESIYAEVRRKCTDYLVANVEQNGFIRASRTYPRYGMHWIRDSSMVALALFTTGDTRAIEAARRINTFNMMVIEKHIGGIVKGLQMPAESREYFHLEHHLPPKVDRSGQLFCGELRINGNKVFVDDTRLVASDCGFRQIDSIPLILMSINAEQNTVGLTARARFFLRTRLPTLLSYMGKSYVMEAGNAWEIGHDRIHAYNVAAVHSGINAARNLTRQGLTGINDGDINRLIVFSPDYSGPIDFLARHFVKDGILYRQMLPFSTIPETSQGVDASMAYMFTMFGVTDAAMRTPGVVASTIEAIENTLYRKNMMPIRFVDDVYFTGGNWIPPGLQFATYYAHHGEVNKACEAFDYVIRKYGHRFPEQELVNPANPRSDHEGFLAENLGRPIGELAWAYADMIRLCNALEEVGTVSL